MASVNTLRAELLLDVRNSTGESPVWHAAEQALYWVDIPEKTLHRFHVQSAQHRQWAAPEMLACMVRGGGADNSSNGNGSSQWLVAAETGLIVRVLSGEEEARYAALGADVVLVGDSLAGLATLRGVARQAQRRLRQNLAWALGYNLVVLPLALGGWLTPWLAALGMSLSSLLVVGNALRLRTGEH